MDMRRRKCPDAEARGAEISSRSIKCSTTGPRNQASQPFHPLGVVLVRVLRDTAVRAIRFHWGRANDFTLEEDARQRARHEGHAILESAIRHGLIHAGSVLLEGGGYGA